MVDVSKRMSPGQARKVLNQSLAVGGVSFTTHALQEMEKDGITFDDVYGVLKAGRIAAPELESGAWRYRISRERDWVVVAFRSETASVVVTAWRKKP